MDYQSPINVIMGQMSMAYENGIWQAIQKVGMNIDQSELLKALQYDRGQYQKGYTDRDSEIVRCKDCKHYKTIYCTCDGCCISDDWFCADGERNDDDA